MRRLVLVMVFASSAFFLFSTHAIAQTTDAWIGTWTLNLAQSSSDPANLAPKSQTMTREAVEGGMKLVTDGVDAQGKATHTEYTAKYDKKDYPWSGQANADTISLT